MLLHPSFQGRDVTEKRSRRRRFHWYLLKGARGSVNSLQGNPMWDALLLFLRLLRNTAPPSFSSSHRLGLEELGRPLEEQNDTVTQRHPRRIGSTPPRQRAQVVMMSHAGEGTCPIMAGLRSPSPLDNNRVELTNLPRPRQGTRTPSTCRCPSARGNVFPVWAALTEMTSQVLSSMPSARTCEHHCLAKGGCCYYSQWSRCMVFDAYMHPSCLVVGPDRVGALCRVNN